MLGHDTAGNGWAEEKKYGDPWLLSSPWSADPEIPGWEPAGDSSPGADFGNEEDWNEQERLLDGVDGTYFPESDELPGPDELEQLAETDSKLAHQLGSKVMLDGVEQ